jgi:Protein of unknown function (DUF2001).
MSILLAKDTLSGQEGTATMNVNGSIETLFYLKNFEATIEKNKESIRTIGKRGEQHKTNGFSGEGSMTIYYVTSRFRQMMLEYAKKGIDLYFDITVTNSDPTSSVGKQTTVVRNCNLDSILIAKLDVEETALEEEVSFTFDDFDILEDFVNPNNM